MTDLEKAARMALEALEKTKDENTAYLDFKEPYHEAITALRQALSDSVEQPASKPWVGLTQQDIDIAFDDTQEGGGFDEFARAIEAKLKEKNA